MSSTWSITNMMQSVTSFMDETGLPKMRPPEAESEYTFPNSVSKLSSIDLGDLNLKLTSWLSQGLQLLAEEDTGLTAFETVYELMVWKQVADARHRKDLHAKLTKEEYRSIIIMESEDLTKQTQALLARKAKVQRLKAQTTIYSEQLSKLSREQSRRDQELKTL